MLTPEEKQRIEEEERMKASWAAKRKAAKKG